MKKILIIVGIVIGILVLIAIGGTRGMGYIRDYTIPPIDLTKIADGTVSTTKHYREVELSETPVSVEVFIDGESKYLSTGKKKFKLPPSLYGKDIQFEIKTINEIRSLKYKYSELKA